MTAAVLPDLCLTSPAGISRQPAVSRQPAEAGRGHLRIALVDGASAVLSSAATSPLKLLVPTPRGTAVWAYSSTYGGGLLGGDHIALDVGVGADARLLLATQASTKVYPADGADWSRQELTATVADGGLLVQLPDPTTAFAGARFRQRLSIACAPSASAVILDWFTAGRSARGESWDFAAYDSRTELTVDGVPVVIDALRLVADGGPTIGARCGGHRCLATLVLHGQQCAEAARAAVATVAALPATAIDGVLIAASPLANGAIIRAAGPGTEDVARALRPHLAFLASLLGDHPWSRKS